MHDVSTFRLTFKLWAVFMLTGCSFVPVLPSSPLPIPESYPEQTNVTNTVGALQPATLAWQDYFADQQLRALISRALENNRDLRQMVLRVEEARIMYGISRAEQLPSLSLGAATARIDLPESINLSGAPQPVTQYIAGFTSSWELDFWGRIASLNEVALNEYLATDSARQAAKTSLIIQVADSYLMLSELEERIQLTDQTTSSRQKSFDMFSRRYQVGSGNKFEFIQAETLLTQSQALGQQLRQSRSLQRNFLAQLVGEASPLSISGNRLNDNIVQTEILIGQPSALLLQRPDIIASEKRLKAANANIGAARAAFLPRIALNASYGGFTSELNSLFDPVSRLWLFIPNLSLPIFDGGRIQANLELSEVRKNLAIANYEKTIQVAFKEVSDNLAAGQSLTEQLTIQTRAVKASSERARLAKLRFDRGSSTYFEVLDAERDHLSVQQQHIQLRRALLSTRVNLFALLGGGSQLEEKTGTEK